MERITKWLPLMLALIAGIVGYVRLQEQVHSQSVEIEELESLTQTLKDGAVGYLRLQDQVSVQSIEIKELDGRTKSLKEWQDDWPRKGRLEADVRQDEQLGFHTTCIERLRERLDRIETMRAR